MTATYDPTDLDKDTATGRVNVVRFLLGDTDVAYPEVQDEEITFTLASASNAVYLAASLCASAISSKYAGYTDTEIDGILSSDYGSLAGSFSKLSVQLKQEGNRQDGTSLGIFLGGMPVSPDKGYTFFRRQFEDPAYKNLTDV